MDASVLLTALQIYEEKEVISELSRDPRAAGLLRSADAQMALLVSVNTVWLCRARGERGKDKLWDKLQPVLQKLIW